MSTYLFSLIMRGLVDAENDEEAREALRNLTLRSDAGDYDFYVDEVCDIVVQELDLGGKETMEEGPSQVEVAETEEV